MRYQIVPDADELDGSVYVLDGMGRKVWLTYDEFEPLAREFLTRRDGARQYEGMKLGLVK